MSRSGALKVLDFATSNVEGTDNCNKFVDILGLRTVFPLFMQTPRKYKKKGASPEEHEGVLDLHCLQKLFNYTFFSWWPI